MPTQAQLDDFTLAFHRVALSRLRMQPKLITQALETLDRWHQQRGATNSDAYMLAWKKLLTQDIDTIEREVCKIDPYAATLRNVSPLGFVMRPEERMAIRQSVMQGA